MFNVTGFVQIDHKCANIELLYVHYMIHHALTRATVVPWSAIFQTLLIIFKQGSYGALKALKSVEF